MDVEKVLWNRQQLSEMLFVIQLQERIESKCPIASDSKWKKKSSSNCHNEPFSFHGSKKKVAGVSITLEIRSMKRIITFFSLSQKITNSVRSSVETRCSHSSSNFKCFRQIFAFIQSFHNPKVMRSRQAAQRSTQISEWKPKKRETMANIYALWSSHLSVVMPPLSVWGPRFSASKTMKHFPKH